MDRQSTSYVRFDPFTRVRYSEHHSQLNCRDTWIILGGFSFYSGARKMEYWVHIPDKFKTVGAIVPRHVSKLLTPDMVGGQAAVLHDYLVRVGRVRVAGTKRIVSLSEANSIFLEAMTVAGVPRTKKWFIYLCALLRTHCGKYRNA